MGHRHSAAARSPGVRSAAIVAGATGLQSWAMAATLYDKLWDAHVVAEVGSIALLYIDRVLLHEVSSPQWTYPDKVERHWLS